MPQTYSVAVDFVGPFDGDPTEINNCLPAFAEELAVYDPVVSGCPEEPPRHTGMYGARLVIAEGSAASAVSQAVSLVPTAAKRARLPDFPIARVQAVEWEQLERDLAQPTHPTLVGVTELAEMVGISRQRASALARTSRFPRPVAELASGPVWLEPNVRRFIKEWDRKPGRPRKVTNSGAENLDNAALAAARGAPFPDPMHEMGGMTTADIPVPEGGEWGGSRHRR